MMALEQATSLLLLVKHKLGFDTGAIALKLARVYVNY